jgi:repressor LexA
VAAFTHRRGQFQASVRLHRLPHKQGPAETDTVKLARVTPPSIHQGVVKLDGLGLITREPGVARSARVAVAVEEIPALEVAGGPPW